MSVPGINEDNGDAGETGEEKALLETDKTVEPPPGIQQLLFIHKLGTCYHFERKK